MKQYIQITVVFAVMLLLIPCIVFLDPQRSAKAQESSQPISDIQSENPADTQSVAIYFTKQKQVVRYTMQEYMLGAVLAQMPADFEPAALQAQAVLARTYALYRIASESESPTAALCGAAMSDDTELYHGFFTPEQAKELYKDEYDSAREKVLAAVKEVSDKLLTYEDKPIIVAFHAVSDGHTRSAQDVWGQDIPYLASVDSSQDESLKQATSQVTLSAEQLKQKLSGVYDDIKFTDEPQDWLKVTQTGEYGLVKSVSVCGKQLDAAEFCETLDLASQSFAFEVKDNSFTFTCHGLGHLVGMSQLGANELAKQGKSCEQILTHYFTDCKLCDY